MTTTRLIAGAFWLLLAIAAVGATSILSDAGIVAYSAMVAWAGILWLWLRSRKTGRI